MRDAIEQAAVSGPDPVRAVVLVLEGNDNLDITSAEELGKLAGNLSGRDVALGLAHVHGPALTMAERSGLLAAVGANHVFPGRPPPCPGPGRSPDPLGSFATDIDQREGVL